MKCPKCGYISFDYNDTCPKCNKNIINERQRMNLPGYKPDPPLLIASLIGESKGAAASGKSPAESRSEPGLPAAGTSGDKGAIEAIEDAFMDSQDLDLDLDSGSFEEEGMGSGELDTQDGLVKEEDDILEVSVGTADEEGTELDLENLSTEKFDDGMGTSSPAPAQEAVESSSIELLDGIEEVDEIEEIEEIDPDAEAISKDQSAPQGRLKKEEKTMALDLDSLELDLDLDESE